MRFNGKALAWSGVAGASAVIGVALSTALCVGFAFLDGAER